MNDALLVTALRATFSIRSSADLQEHHEVFSR